MTDAKSFPTEGLIGSSEIDGPKPTFFENSVFDNVLDSMLELSASIWLCQDRMLIMEEVLSKHLGDGAVFDLNRAIEQYIPSPELDARRAEERAALLDRVFRSFRRNPVAAIEPATQTSSKGDKS